MKKKKNAVRVHQAALQEAFEAEYEDFNYISAAHKGLTRKQLFNLAWSTDMSVRFPSKSKVRHGLCTSDIAVLISPC